ncbi:MAG TPA: FISUMP domain-containing protein [bacterium]|nr:FISUMP domain-containing protein [bacterium]HPN43514.1 FISUMP domain-containing protein [bacterium]
MNYIMTGLKLFSVIFTLMLFSNDLRAQETVTDIDGNVYQTVTIGAQVWMKENLKTTRYRNGDIIGTTSPATLDISGQSAPNYQWAYAGAESNVAIFGRLYTWFTVTDNRNIAPTGWHVPTDAEWTELTSFLGGDSIACGKLKETGVTHWTSPNIGADNSSGFTALPGGNRIFNGSFYLKGDYGFFWTATDIDNIYAYARALGHQVTLIDRGSYNKKVGYSVRCIKDGITSVDDSKNGTQIPAEIKLNQNYPNPFNPTTAISYQLAENSNVKLQIYDTLGRCIKTLVNSHQGAGEHSIVWNGTDDANNPVSSGIYFCRVMAGEMSLQKKMVLVR